MVQTQPMKMAAAEALWETSDPASLSIFTITDQKTGKNTIDIRITWHFTFNLVTRKVDEMGDKSFNISQIVYSFDTENDETIPLPCMTIPQMPFNAAKQVSR